MSKVASNMMHRFRFHIPGDRWGPKEFPPEGPYWCTGYSSVAGQETNVVVAYSPSFEVLTGQNRWPDAIMVEDCGELAVSFTDRFPEPDWWKQTLMKKKRTHFKVQENLGTADKPCWADIFMGETGYIRKDEAIEEAREYQSGDAMQLRVIEVQEREVWNDQDD